MAVGEMYRRVRCVHVAEEVGELGSQLVFGAGLAIRPDPPQRADSLGLFRQLLAMDVEDAEGLDGGEVGEDKTSGNGQ